MMEFSLINRSIPTVHETIEDGIVSLQMPDINIVRSREASCVRTHSMITLNQMITECGLMCA